jgi:hypothetical protein
MPFRFKFNTFLAGLFSISKVNIIKIPLVWIVKLAKPIKLVKFVKLVKLVKPTILSYSYKLVVNTHRKY